MKKILVADDNHRIAQGLMIRLKHAGYDVVLAHDGTSAVAAAVRERPDLMILDISMPAGNGFSVVTKLREIPETATTPVVFITASKKSGLADEAKKQGAVAFFEKPYDTTVLLKTIAQSLQVPTPSDGDWYTP